MLTIKKREELEAQLTKAGLTEDRLNLLALLADKLHAATMQTASAGDCLQAAVALLPAAK
jgi:hypothetical protein